MVLKFNFLQKTVEKQESQRKETSKQSTKRQKKCCSTRRSQKIQRGDDPGCFQGPARKVR